MCGSVLLLYRVQTCALHGVRPYACMGLGVHYSEFGGHLPVGVTTIIYGLCKMGYPLSVFNQRALSSYLCNQRELRDYHNLCVIH